MKKMIYILMALLCSTSVLFSEFSTVKIVSVTGQVKVREGLDENWIPAREGMQLKIVDTILSESEARAVIDIPGKGRFVIGGNTLLDIGDLREISEKEMFLFLMSQKVKKMSPSDGKTELKIGNVSVVHGEDRGKTDATTTDQRKNLRREQEKNGAEALYSHHYFTNAVVKLTNIILRYPGINDCGEVYFFLGKAFEALNKIGQAMDAYRQVLNQKDCNSASARKWSAEAQQALERLK